jgi:hypothetical protein
VSTRRAFDIDAIMRDVRAAANRSYLATRATLLQKSPQRSNVAAVASEDVSEIEERAGLADSVPAVYRDAWARLCHQNPADVSEAEWRRALDDGGRFLDAVGNHAAEFGCTPGELFDVSRGLIWRLGGERVQEIGPRRVRLRDGTTLERGG